MNLATVNHLRATLDRWEEKANDPRFHHPTMRAEYCRAWDRHNEALTSFCKKDPQAFAEAFPHSIALYVEHMPDTEARRAAAFACETDDELRCLIADWKGLAINPIGSMAASPHSPLQDRDGEVNR